MRIFEITDDNFMFGKLRNLAIEIGIEYELLDRFLNQLVENSSSLEFPSVKQYVKNRIDEFESRCQELINEKGFNLKNDPDMKYRMKQAGSFLKNIKQRRRQLGL